MILCIRSNIEYTGHFHSAGAAGRNELHENRKLYSPALCCAIAVTGYDGCIGQEFTPPGDGVAAREQAYKACHV